MSKDHGTAHIYQSLIANLVIAVAKGGAAFITGSGALLAETIHTFADCGNQLLLLRGVKQARRAPDATHPMGYGRSVYFWSFMVALLLFSGGGMFSIYEGVHKLHEPEPVEQVGWGFGILGFSFLLEGWSLLNNIRDMNARRKSKPFMKYIKDTKDSDLVVVFGENLAAVLGLFIAFVALFVAWRTGDGRADAVGSLLVGIVLVGVAVFLAREVQSLLLGESGDPEIEAAARALAIDDPRIECVIHCITIQQGPGEVLVACKIKCEPNLTARDVSVMINDFEARLRERCPEVRWLYVEPDLQEWKGTLPNPEQREDASA